MFANGGGGVGVAAGFVIAARFGMFGGGGGIKLGDADAGAAGRLAGGWTEGGVSVCGETLGAAGGMATTGAGADAEGVGAGVGAGDTFGCEAVATTGAGAADDGADVTALF